MSKTVPHLIAPIAVVMLCVAACRAAATDPAGQEPLASTTRPAEELFSKQIAPGQRIVVTREPFPIARLGQLLKPTAVEGTTVASLHVELQTGDQLPVLIASAIESDFPDFRKGFSVIDVFVGREELVIAASLSDQICLWRIALDVHRHLPDGWTWVNSSVPYAAIIPFKRETVSIEMTPIEQGPRDQKWSLTVVDKRPPKHVTLRFEQTAGAWGFRPLEPEGLGNRAAPGGE